MKTGIVAFSLLAVSVSCMAVVLASPSAASAQQTEGARDATGIDAEARSFYDLGRVQFDNERYAAAAESWRRAFQLSNRTVLLYNIYLAHDRANAGDDATHIRGAEEALQQYLDRSPTTMDERPELEQRLAALRERIAALPPEEAEPTAEEQEEAEPTDEQAEPEVTLAASDIVGQDAPAAVSTSSHGLAWALVGTGAAFAIAGGITGVMAAGVESDLEAGCNAETLVCAPEYADDLDSRDTLALITDISLATGAALMITGIVLRLTGGASDDVAESRIRVGAEITSTRAVGALHVRF